MRFKAKFSERGIEVLEKWFLPTLEKFGKTCQLLLGPEELFFLQTGLNTDGPHVSLRFQAGVIFEADTYSVASKHHDLIAFHLEVGQLALALKGAATNHADAVEIKLTQKQVAAVDGGGTQTRPYLTLNFSCRLGGVEHSLPVSWPYSPDEIDRLVEDKDVAALCPFYIDLAAAGPRLSATVDGMKHLGGVLRLTLCRTGDAHVQVEGPSVLLGAALAGLPVFPEDQAMPPESLPRTEPPEVQMHESLESGIGSSVFLQVKSLLRVLGVGALTAPSKMLTGIDAAKGYVHVLFVYCDPHNAGEAWDDSLGLSFKLPVREDS